jgi:hypothetical protein
MYAGSNREKAGMRLSFLLFAVLSAGSLMFVTYRYSREELIVDRCLSDEHGSFDYFKMSCDLETNHPYIPYQTRHPRDKQTAMLSSVSFAVFLFGYRRLRFSIQEGTVGREMDAYL